MFRAALLAAVLAVLVLPPAADAAPWRWPVPERAPARAFAVGPDRFAAGQHRGVDLPAPVGTPVRAACGGAVRFAGELGDAGRTVSVTCGALVASYLHLGGILVRRGTVVDRGDVLGLVGRSGRPRGGPHLHLGARRVADGRYVDPLTLLGAPAPWVPPPSPAPAARRPVRRRPGRAPRRAPQPARQPAPRLAADDAAARPWAALAGLVLLAAAAAPAARSHRPRRRWPGSSTRPAATRR